MKPVAAKGKKPLVILAAIVGEGAIVVAPLVMLVKKRHFGVNSAI